MERNITILPKHDIVFKSIFKAEENKDVVEDFLKAVLDIPKEVVFEDILVEDPELLPDASGGKLSILDVRLRIPEQGIVNIEMQFAGHPEMKERLLHCWARVASKQLSAGDNYGKFGKVVMVVIADFNLVGDSDSYINRYRLYDKEHDSLFTDLEEFAILELKKVPRRSDGTPAWAWGRFFGSSTDQEMREVASANEKVGKAMLIVQKLSREENLERYAEYEEMMERDYISRMNHAEKVGMEKGMEKGMKKGMKKGMEKGFEQAHEQIALQMKADGMDPALIAKYTGLTIHEVEAIEV